MKAYQCYFYMLSLVAGFTNLGQAQTVLTPTNQTNANAVWAGFTWDTWGASSEERRTSQLNAANQSITTEIYFYNALEGYELHDDWRGSIEATLSSGDEFITGAQGASIFNYPIFSAYGLRNEIGDTLANSSFSSGSAGAVKFDLDFTNMVHGYLPAGTMIWVWDIEAFPVSARHEGPVVISSSIGEPFLELTWQGNNANSSSTTILPEVRLQADGSYILDNANDVYFNNGTPDATVFVTTKDLTDLSISTRSAAGGAHTIYMYAPALITPVPEPSSGLLVVGALSSLLCYRRRPSPWRGGDK